MRLNINLAKKPFHNRRLFWLSFLVVMGVLLLAGQWMLKEVSSAKMVAARLEQEVKKQQAELKTLEKQYNVPIQPLNPTQIQEIEASAQLIKQRSFSWTQMLSEFELALPKTIRIISIRPTKEEEALNIPLKIKVYSKSVKDLTDMIAEIDKVGDFQVNPVNQETPLQNGDIGFTLDVLYNPRPAKSFLAKKSQNKAEIKKVANNEDED